MHSRWEEVGVGAWKPDLMVAEEVEAEAEEEDMKRRAGGGSYLGQN
jgi:hypothetical protein